MLDCLCCSMCQPGRNKRTVWTWRCFKLQSVRKCLQDKIADLILDFLFCLQCQSAALDELFGNSHEVSFTWCSFSHVQVHSHQDLCDWMWLSTAQQQFVSNRYKLTIVNPLSLQCFRRYRSAQILFHSLSQQAHNVSDKRMLSKCKCCLELLSRLSNSNTVNGSFGLASPIFGTHLLPARLTLT